MKHMSIPAALASTAVILGLALAGSASASTIACSGTTNEVAWDISDKVAPSSDCLILEPLNANTNDSVAGGNANNANFTVNVKGFFDADVTKDEEDELMFPDTLWAFDGKALETGEDTPTLFSFTGDAQSGTFRWVGEDYDGRDIMFVFKDGGNTNLVAYLIDMGSLLDPDGFDNIGTYASPFVEPPFVFPGSGARDISHISVYYREGLDIPEGNGIPEPATLALFGGGLALLGVAIRRRNRVERSD